MHNAYIHGNWRVAILDWTDDQISTIPTQSHPTGYIVSNAGDLLQIFDADAGLLVIGDGCKLLGHSDQGTAMLAIAEYLRIMKFE